MLVIHPKDKTTAMLSALYDGLEAQVVADCRSTKGWGICCIMSLRRSV